MNDDPRSDGSHIDDTARRVQDAVTARRPQRAARRGRIAPGHPPARRFGPAAPPRGSDRPRRGRCARHRRGDRRRRRRRRHHDRRSGRRRIHDHHRSVPTVHPVEQHDHHDRTVDRLDPDHLHRPDGLGRGRRFADDDRSRERAAHRGPRDHHPGARAVRRGADRGPSRGELRRPDHRHGPHDRYDDHRGAVDDDRGRRRVRDRSGRLLAADQVPPWPWRRPEGIAKAYLDHSGRTTPGARRIESPVRNGSSSRARTPERCGRCRHPHRRAADRLAAAATACDGPGRCRRRDRRRSSSSGRGPSRRPTARASWTLLTRPGPGLRGDPPCPVIGNGDVAWSAEDGRHRQRRRGAPPFSPSWTWPARSVGRRRRSSSPTRAARTAARSTSPPSPSGSPDRPRDAADPGHPEPLQRRGRSALAGCEC